MATSVQQRGETAVLGIGSRPTPLVSSPSLDAPVGYMQQQRLHAPLGDSIISIQEAKLAARGVARRKLRRRENARFSSNPHIARPSASDIALTHPNQRRPSFPLPAQVQSMLSSNQMATGSNASRNHDDDFSSKAGRFSMTYADAHFFLAHRVGIRVGHECSEGQMGVLQAFTKRVEAELQAWLHQEVFLAPDNLHRDQDTLLDLNSHDDQRDFRIVQVSKNPHNLVWEVPDSFLRLAVHCLARVLHCPTFSKDNLLGQRQTWILNPHPGRGNVEASLSHSMLDTPPTTDIGTDAGTDIASDLASEIDSEWAMSEIGENEESYETISIDQEESEHDIVVVPYRIDEEDDNLADIEDD
jgi:hypothetical protein